MRLVRHGANGSQESHCVGTFWLLLPSSSSIPPLSYLLLQMPCVLEGVMDSWFVDLGLIEWALLHVIGLAFLSYMSPASSLVVVPESAVSPHRLHKRGFYIVALATTAEASYGMSIFDRTLTSLSRFLNADRFGQLVIHLVVCDRPSPPQIAALYADSPSSEALPISTTTSCFVSNVFRVKKSP